jgi:hypothetical protein
MSLFGMYDSNVCDFNFPSVVIARHSTTGGCRQDGRPHPGRKALRVRLADLATWLAERQVGNTDWPIVTLHPPSITAHPR